MFILGEIVADLNMSSVNRDLLLAGILLHDIGKVCEFKVSPATGLVIGYTEEGNLLGHSVLGVREITEAADIVAARPEVSLMLQQMVFSHHGDPTAGAAKVPMTIEAQILHDLDSLDSQKQVFCRTAFRSVSA